MSKPKNRYSEKTEYKGVYRSKDTGGFAAYYCFAGVQYYCGRHECPRKAAKARDIKIIDVRGDLRELQILKPIA